MRALAVIAVFAGACAHHSEVRAEDPSAPPDVAPAFLATRWVPPNPTYVVTSKSVFGAQKAIAGIIDAVGVLVGANTESVGRRLASVGHLNPLRPDGLAQFGIDLKGGIAVFSDELDPTLVVHLASPEQTLAFFDRMRDAGLPTESVIVDKVEIYTTKLNGSTRLSWAVADEWLWLHLAFGTHDPGSAWFGAKRGPARWRGDWKWAETSSGGLANTGLVGFADVKAVASRLAARIPAAVACAKLAEPIGRLGFAAEAGDDRVAGRLSIDLGANAARLAGVVVAPPAGWDGSSEHAALGVQMNVDLAGLLAFVEPCTRTFGLPTINADALHGIRAVRAFFDDLELDFDSAVPIKSARGAVAIDGGVKLVADALDQIPMRARLESEQTFGTLHGHELSIPFGPTIDYVLTDNLAIVADGEGVMAALATGTPKPPALFALDITPGKLPAARWVNLLNAVHAPEPEPIVSHMMAWQDGHLTLSLAGQELVLEAHGTRGNRR